MMQMVMMQVMVEGEVVDVAEGKFRPRAWKRRQISKGNVLDAGLL